MPVNVSRPWFGDDNKLLSRPIVQPEHRAVWSGSAKFRDRSTSNTNFHNVNYKTFADVRTEFFDALNYFSIPTSNFPCKITSTVST